MNSSDDIDPPAISTGPHYNLTPHEPAHVPGPRAPEPASREPVPPARDWDELVRETRHLFRVARNPYSDSLWAVLFVYWLDWERWLIHRKKAWAQGKEEAEVWWELDEKHQTARRFLGRK